VAGSSNFDFMSYHILEEHLFIADDPAIVAAFIDRVWRPHFERAVDMRDHPDVRTRLGSGLVRVAAGVAAALARP
jgi:hypothetical protein